jgi:aldose 1-epimerase
MVQLKNRWWQVSIDENKGGSITEARCYSERYDNYRLTVGTHGAVDPANSAPAPVSFVMLPFCNRIDQGTFTYKNQTIAFPINRPDQSVAIHGISRDLPWRIAKNTESAVELTQTVDSGPTPYRYKATLSYRLEEDRFSAALSVTNLAAQALPYGMGFHPFFAVSDDANLALSAKTYIDLDKRGLPLTPLSCQRTDLRFNRRENLGMDRYFHGWNGGATITDPSWAGALAITGLGALTNVHVFLSPIWRSMCVEPVSHAPAVLNRRDLAACGDLQELAQNQSLSGEMQLRWLPDDDDPA